eukprot:14738986-Ditylum_brightwellii.AAC.1
MAPETVETGKHSHVMLPGGSKIKRAKSPVMKSPMKSPDQPARKINSCDFEKLDDDTCMAKGTTCKAMDGFCQEDCIE